MARPKKEHPLSWIKPNREILEEASKREHQGDSTDDFKVQIAVVHTGEYPDGTPWEREATPEEEEQLKSWSK